VNTLIKLLELPAGVPPLLQPVHGNYGAGGVGIGY
jgi:hypothetical protein